MKRLAYATGAMALACFFSTGCQPATNTGKAPASSQSSDHGHDHGEGGHPETLKEGFAQLNDIYSVIKTAFTSNKVDDAHGPLHSVGHLLEDMEKLVEKSDLDAEGKTKADAGIKTLLDSFGKIDDMFHGGPKADFAELDKAMGPAMEELKGLIK